MGNYNTNNRDARKRVYENYTPIVLWVDLDKITDTSEGMYDKEEIFRRDIREKINEEYPFVNIHMGDYEPRNTVVTEFDALDALAQEVAGELNRNS